MAYQNVGTPRFFIDNYMYLRAIGLDPQAYIDETSESNELGDDANETPLTNENAFTLSPHLSKQFTRTEGDASTMRFFIPCGDMVKGMDFSGNMKWYGALLNHNLGDCSAEIQSSMFMPSVNQIDYIGDPDYIPILNSGTTELSLNGSSIWYSDNIPAEDDNARFTGFNLLSPTTDEAEGNFNNFQIGAVSMGVMYTMPVSVDLNLNMDIEFDGYDEIETSGGSTLANIRQTGTPIWVNDGKYNSPFSVGEFSDSQDLMGAKRNGRRTWSLKFSYIADTDLFASNYMNTDYNETMSGYNDADLDTENQFEYNIFTDDSFVAQVWNKTLGGALPFIFQPDSNNDNPDQFCIAKFDQDTLSIKQVAFRTYSFSIKIREVW